MKKGTPKDTFVLLGRRSKRAKDKQMNEKSLFGQKRDLRRVRALVRTCKEPQKFIEFSAFSGIYFYKFSPFYRESFLCHSEESNGDPAGYCVPVGKRNKQAKDKHFRF